MPPSPPSGEQHEIRHGDQVVVVTEVGATLRSYSAGGVDVVDGFGIDEIAQAGRGQVLAPWPNRIDGGRYSFEGREGRAAIDEPKLGNAIHGLVRWLPWVSERKTDDAVALRCRLAAQPAYPWHLELEIEYRLSSGGLHVEVRATNASGVAAPFGIGFHPYVTTGTNVDEAALAVPASRRLITDERSLPMGDEQVEGTDVDFRSARTIGGAQLDTCFVGVRRDSDGRWRASVGGGGRHVEVWAGEGFDYVQVYTGDTLEPIARRRQGTAIEPMTCPPNAFASGTDVIRLDPDASWSGAWGIAASGGEA